MASVLVDGVVTKAQYEEKTVKCTKKIINSCTNVKYTGIDISAYNYQLHAMGCLDLVRYRKVE